MPTRKNFDTILTTGSVLTLAACAAPARMHDITELNAVGVRCGLALGELIQDESEKRLLLLIKPGATVEQRACVTRWAKRNSLKPVIVDTIQFPAS